MGVPIDPVIVLPMGLRREVTVEFEQVMAPLAFSRFCVMVFVKDVTLSPPAKMRFLMLLQSQLEFWAFSRAATPVTWGVAIEVPLDIE